MGLAGHPLARATALAALLSLALVLAAGSLTVAGLTSHSSAAAWRGLALSAHAAHLIAAVLWVGALLWFASRFWTAALARLEPQDSTTGPVNLTLDRAGEGVFTRQGSFIGLTGAWTGKVVVQRDGAFDLNHRFDFTVRAGPPPGASARAPVSPLDPVVAVVALGAAAICTAVYRTSRRDLLAAEAAGSTTTTAPAAGRRAR